MSRKLQIIKLMNKIVAYLKKRPGEYVKLDDIQIDLLQIKSKHETPFDKAYKILLMQGRIELLGNEIRILP